MKKAKQKINKDDVWLIKKAHEQNVRTSKIIKCRQKR